MENSTECTGQLSRLERNKTNLDTTLKAGITNFFDRWAPSGNETLYVILAR